jgi:hypothetical protein
MRTRWLFLALALSLAANVLAGVALWRLHRLSPEGPARGLGESAPCAEEQTIREDLSRHLCAGQPDRRAIRATLQRLAALRHQRLEEAVEQWLATSCQAPGSERDLRVKHLNQRLCPWRETGDGCCAPPPASGATPIHPAPPVTGEKEKA